MKLRRQRKKSRKQTWDFNPKRGLAYFLIGWVFFPFLMVLDAFSGADLTLSAMALGTVLMSVLVGIVGTFTENIGV